MSADFGVSDPARAEASLGALLRSARRGAGLTGQALIEQLVALPRASSVISPVALSFFETGRRIPTPPRLALLARVLELRGGVLRRAVTLAGEHEAHEARRYRQLIAALSIFDVSDEAFEESFFRWAAEF